LLHSGWTALYLFGRLISSGNPAGKPPDKFKVSFSNLPAFNLIGEWVIVQLNAGARNLRQACPPEQTNSLASSASTNQFRIVVHTYQASNSISDHMSYCTADSE
jgi:hypothetical protein